MALLPLHLSLLVGDLGPGLNLRRAKGREAGQRRQLPRGRGSGSDQRRDAAKDLSVINL
jgi:hypothetical protein